jgi:host factor-I protein
MSKSGMNLQDSFLNQVRRENADIKVLLVNGTVLRGVVKGFDNFTVILNGRNGQQHLIYKHAIAQLVHTRGPEHRRDGEDKAGEGEGDQPPAVAASENDGTQQQQQKHRKEGFNTLDFSHLKLPKEAKEAKEAKTAAK